MGTKLFCKKEKNAGMLKSTTCTVKMVGKLKKKETRKTPLQLGKKKKREEAGFVLAASREAG